MEFIDHTIYKLRSASKNNGGPCIIYITGQFMEFDIEEAYKNISDRVSTDEFILCELLVNDWDRYLTPWPSSNLLQGREFIGEGKVLLDELRDVVIKELSNKYHNITDFIIAGYSLAGLFSIWAAQELNIFRGAVSCSGSLWYKGFEEYMDESNLLEGKIIYLSLGDKESSTKNEYMKRVGIVTEALYNKLSETNKANQVIFEWNKGGHFKDVDERVLKGISWCLLQISKPNN